MFDEHSSPLLDDNLKAAGIQCVSPGNDPDERQPGGMRRLLDGNEGSEGEEDDIICFKVCRVEHDSMWSVVVVVQRMMYCTLYLFLSRHTTTTSVCAPPRRQHALQRHHTQDLDVTAMSPVKAARVVAVNGSAEGPWSAAMTLPELVESNKKHTINGLLFCNVPGLNMSVGDTYVVLSMMGVDLQDLQDCVQ